MNDDPNHALDDPHTLVERCLAAWLPLTHHQHRSNLAHTIVDTLVAAAIAQERTNQARRVLPVWVPTVAGKQWGTTDAQAFHAAALELDVSNTVVNPNARMATVALLLGAYSALERHPIPDPRWSYARESAGSNAQATA